ncbi:ubiquinol-cytochrome-c reductase complex subunit-domain-containing protein [Cryomyces antarcticus]
MQPTIRRMVEGHHGMQPWAVRPDYGTYKSPYGPAYKVKPNFHGISFDRALKFGITAGSFGAVAGIFALFFFAEVPKVRKDIMQRVPIIGDYFVREIPPKDNPF